MIRRQEDPSLDSYCIEKGKLAVVYAATARYICPELESQISNDREITELSEHLHLDILESLNGFEVIPKHCLVSYAGPMLR